MRYKKKEEGFLSWFFFGRDSKVDKILFQVMGKEVNLYIYIYYKNIYIRQCFSTMYNMILNLIHVDSFVSAALYTHQLTVYYYSLIRSPYRIKYNLFPIVSTYSSFHPY